MLLEVENISVFYGDVQALWDVSLHVDQSEIVALIGSNGVGKSTTLRTISGLLRPRHGHIVYEETDLSSIPPSKMVEHGVAHVPEGRRLFPKMTVEENLFMGAYRPEVWKERGQDLEEVFQIFPRLEERKRQLAGTLSGGEQQMLAIGRALMAKPRLLMLDEPSLGLAPNLVEVIFQRIQWINEQGVTVLLVEQNARLALQMADRAYVIETGRIVKEGTGQELLADDSVRKAYLGV